MILLILGESPRTRIYQKVDKPTSKFGSLWKSPVHLCKQEPHGCTKGERKERRIRKGGTSDYFSLYDILIADQGGKKRKGKIPCHRKYLTCERQHKILGKGIRIIYCNRHLCQG